MAAGGVVIATGAAARTLPGSEGLAGVRTLRTLNDVRALRDQQARGRRLVAIGGGFVGAEVASTAYTLGLDVTVVEAAPAPFAGPLGETKGAVVSALRADHGVQLFKCDADGRTRRSSSPVTRPVPISVTIEEGAPDDYDVLAAS